MMILKNKTVAIIGAGPVGLTIARLLQQAGVAVTVYERDKDPQARIWGGTLDLHESTGQQAMRQAGLLDHYLAVAKPMGRTITDEQAKILLAVPTDTNSPEINRNDLRTILLNSLVADTVMWNNKLTGLTVKDGQWLLHFDNGTDALADVVIGANGGMSGIRKYVSDGEVLPSGSYIIQGEVAEPATSCPGIYRLCNDTILMTAGKGVNFVANPDNKAALTYGVTFSTPEAWVAGHGLDFGDAESVRNFLLSRCDYWDARYAQLFHATSVFWGLPARKLDLDRPWKDNRPLPITLIGDAAHLMPPFAGQGVNTGMMDALILSDNLLSGKFASIAAAISDYEQQMLVYAQQAQQETSRNEAAMHHPDFSFLKRFGG